MKDNNVLLNNFNKIKDNNVLLNKYYNNNICSRRNFKRSKKIQNPYHPHKQTITYLLTKIINDRLLFYIKSVLGRFLYKIKKAKT